VAAFIPGSTRLAGTSDRDGLRRTNLSLNWTSHDDPDAITKAIDEIAEHRAPIEQAKGVLMVVYDIDADAALDLLKCRSQETDTKLRVLSERLMKDFRFLHWRHEDASRAMFDRMFLTAHERIDEP
jgi:ANTAR domain-containing protein